MGRVILAFLLALQVAACAPGAPILQHDLLSDEDGDGVPFHRDCAPTDPEVCGDADGDGYYDYRCWDQRPLNLPWPRVEALSKDCDDRNPWVHPVGVRVKPFVVVAEVGQSPRDPGVCAEVPDWATDGVDNDCNGLVDVYDFDGDGFEPLEAMLAQHHFVTSETPVDCDDCRATVNPGIDETETVVLEDGVSCPLYAYDGIDNDCDGADVVDADGDGVEGWWHPDSLCGEHVNETWAEAGAAVTNAWLVEVNGVGQGEFDCNDGDPDIHPEQFERCDDVDWNCSMPKEDWSAEPDEAYTLDGYPLRDDGRGRVIFVDDDARADWRGAEGEPTARIADVIATLDECTEVRIGPGRYVESLRLRAEGDDTTDSGGVEAPLVVPQDLRFRGWQVDEEHAALWQAGDAAALEIEQGSEGRLELRGLSFSGGGAQRCVVATNTGELEVVDSSFSGCRAPDGGGGLRAVAQSSVVMRGATFEGNHADGDGGGLWLLTRGLLGDDLTFTLNAAEGDGGAAHVSVLGDGGSATCPEVACLTELTLNGNEAGGDGGGLYLHADALALGQHGTFGLHASGNSAGLLNGVTGGDGGAAFIDVVGEARISDVQLGEPGAAAGNTAQGHGGGLAIEADDVEVEGLSSYDSRSVAGDGGGLYIVAGRTTGAGSVAMSDVDIDCGGASAAAADFGGGLWLHAVTGDLWDVSVSNCGARYDGGGVYIEGLEEGNQASHLDLRASSARDNLAGGAGGGLWAAVGETRFEDVVLSGNHAVGDGGGLYLAISHGQAALLEGVDVGSNSAGWSGGGMFLTGAGSVTVGSGSSLDSNQAQGGDGGAIKAYALSGFTLQDAYVAGSMGGTDATGYGGGVDLQVIDSAELADVTFSGLGAGTSGGALSGRTIGLLTLGSPGEQAQADPLVFSPTFTIEESSARLFGGGLYLRNVDEVQAADLLLRGNDSGSNGNQLALNQVDGDFDRVDVRDGGAMGASGACASDGCDGLDTMYQAHGDVSWTNSMFTNNYSDGWVIKVSQTGRLYAWNVLIDGNETWGGVWAKNTAAFLGRSVTLRGLSSQRYGVKGGRRSVVILGCSVISLLPADEGAGSAITQSDLYGQTPGLFCVSSNGTIDGASSSSNDHVCELDTGLQLSAASPPTITGIGGGCADCVSETGLSCSEELYPQETFQDDEEDTNVHSGLVLRCGEGLHPVGFSGAVSLYPSQDLDPVCP